jgi:hypothetical protein
MIENLESREVFSVSVCVLLPPPPPAGPVPIPYPVTAGIVRPVAPIEVVKVVDTVSSGLVE